VLTDGRHRGYLADTKSVIVLNIVVIILPGVADHGSNLVYTVHCWTIRGKWSN